tara:strand:+ start:4106 stop:4312 length:207 start_codon:yes stop_codon:yes gene_type:complete
MIDGTLPSDTQGATQALKQRKLILAEVHAEILENSYVMAYEVTGLIDNKMDAINKRIETGELWEMDDE